MRRIEKHKVSWTDQYPEDPPVARIMGPEEPEDPDPEVAAEINAALALGEVDCWRIWEPEFPVKMRQRAHPIGAIEAFCAQYQVKVWKKNHQGWRYSYAYLNRKQLLAFELEFR